MGVYITMGILKFAADVAISKLVAPEQATYVVLRWLRRCANSSRRSGVPRIDRSDYGCRLDGGKGLHHTGTVWHQFGFLTPGPLAVIVTPTLFGHLKQHGAVA
jgi:hypothetical protein